MTTRSARRRIKAPGPTRDRGNDAKLGRPRFSAAAAIAALLVASGLVFCQVRRFDFSDLDDRANVVNNPHYHPLSLSSFRQIWSQPYLSLYIPVTYSYFAGIVWWTELGQTEGQVLSPAAFHLGNLALHAICVVLVFVILRRLLAHNGAACLGALLFSVHPLHVESVAWITEAKGLLAAAFCLLAIWQYLDFANPTQSGSKARRTHYVVALAAFVLALLSKPSAVSLPVIIGLVDCLWLKRGWREVLLTLAPWALCAAAVTVLTKSEQPDIYIAAVPVWARPTVAADALLFYFAKTVWPFWLGPEYGRPPRFVTASPWVYAEWIPLVAIGAAASFLANRRVWWTALGVYVAGVLPVLGIVPFGYQNNSTVADRYVYLSLLGLSLAVGWIAQRYWSRRLLIVGGVVIALLAIASYRQTARWRDTKTLFNYNVAAHPRSWLSREKLANVLYRGGRIEEAIEQFRQGIAVNPESADLRNKLGHVYMLAHRNDAAEEQFAIAAGLEPTLVEPHYNLGVVRSARGDSAGAIEQYRRALALRPGYAMARNNLVITLTRLDRLDEAIVELREGIRLDAHSEQLRCDLASLLSKRRDYAAAIVEYQAALTIRPDSLKPAAELAWLLATCPELALQDGPRAVALAERCCQITGFRDSHLLDILAAAYARAGRFEDAVRVAQQALAQASASRNRTDEDALRARLRLYSQRRAYEQSR